MPADRWPKFGDLQGSYYSLPLKPPFSITDLSCRLFPLRANINSVQNFCDNYVNILPSEIGHFRACSPYVMLMMLDYGSLALEATNLGWFSQHEIMFCVPTEWYRIERGKWIFQDWAMLTPFIFVDDDLSLNMGRTVAGWPKTYASMTPTLSTWMKDPLAPVSEATVSASVFPELYAGKRQEERVILEIEREAPMSNLRLPFNTNSPIAPWTIAGNVVESMARLGRDSLGWMKGLGILPTHNGSTPDNYAAMMRKMAGAANPLRPNMTSNILNVKQFRASEDPDRYCYQAVTMGSMRFTKFNGIGVLGEQAVMLGDISGGYSIKLHEWPSVPITRLLGLEVEKRWRGDGVNVAQLKPVMPYWYDANMDYQTGYNVGWRTRGAIWIDRDGREHSPKKVNGRMPPEQSLYNSTLGPSAKPIAGPFRFSGTTIRVMPLLANRDKLDAYLQSYLNDPIEPAGERFALWAPDTDPAKHAYVYMTATSFGDVTSGTNNIGEWADRELAFLIPVRRERLVNGAWQVVGVGVVPAYTYVDNVAAAISGTEVLGIPTIGARFDDAESSWMSEEGPANDAAQTLLLVDAEILPAVGEGERTQKRRIVEIMQGRPIEADSPVAWRVIGDRWAATLRHELERKYATRGKNEQEMHTARALGLGLLGNGVPLSVFTMKQFRDNADPDVACYQSIVQIQRTLIEVLDLREIEEPLVIRMHDFPTQPIVATLGLVGKPIRDDGVGVAYALQPIRPFWLRVTKEEDLGQPLMYRAGTEQWTRAEADAQQREEESHHPAPHAPRPPSVFDDATDVPTSRRGGTVQDRGDPRRLESTLEDGQTPSGGSTPESITAANARAAVQLIDPQMVIESMLSREWGNWADDTRWRAGRRDLDKRYAETVAGIPAHKLALAEKTIFALFLEDIRNRGIEKSVVDGIAALLEHLVRFNQIRTLLSLNWSKLVDWTVEQRYPAEVRNDVHPVLTNGELITALQDTLKQIEILAAMPVYGVPASLDGRRDFAARDNAARLQELWDGTLVHLNGMIGIMVASPEYLKVKNKPYDPNSANGAPERDDALRSAYTQVWTVHQVVREAVGLAEARCELQRDALFSQLSKAYQKPDFCVRRDAAGPEKDRLFPLAESMGSEPQWYVGAIRPKPRPAKPAPPAERSPEVAPAAKAPNARARSSTKAAADKTRRRR